MILRALEAWAEAQGFDYCRRLNNDPKRLALQLRQAAAPDHPIQEPGKGDTAPMK